MTASGMTLAGRYQLLDRIGAGGMATVWRARDTRLGRFVAVKLLRPQFADDPEFTGRFEVEARNAASLSNANVATVFDTGEDEGERYIVMELVDGPSVADILRANGPLPPGQAVDVAAACARALAAAHRRGLIHRDVKPANILVGRDGRVRLADFGIARALTTSRVTAPGTVLGSIPYLSPEQARGEEASAAGDVFSLGVVLYEMLTGRLPWTADGPAALATVRTTEPPIPLSAARADLPRGLEPIVDRALRIDPATRYPSARSFAESLETWARRNAATLPPEPDLAETARLVAAATPFAGASGADDSLVAAVPGGQVLAGAALARANPAAGTLPPPGPIGRAYTAPDVPAHTAALPRLAPPPARRPRRVSDTGVPVAYPQRDDRRPLLIVLAALLPAIILGLVAFGNLGRGAPAAGILAPSGTPNVAVLGSASASPSTSAAAAASPSSSASADASASGSPSGPAQSASAEAPSHVAVGPVVAVTPTPRPTPRPTPKPAPRATPRPTAAPAARPPVSADPAQSVLAFYHAVAAHRWDTAIALWSPSMRRRYPPQEWLIDRFRPTTRITISGLRTLSVNRSAGTARVAVTITEYRRTGPSPRRFSGSWDLVAIKGRWLLNQPHF